MSGFDFLIERKTTYSSVPRDTDTVAVIPLSNKAKKVMSEPMCTDMATAKSIEKSGRDHGAKFTRF